MYIPHNDLGPQEIFSEQLHKDKYRRQGETFLGSAGRVARELTDSEKDRTEFEDMLADQRFLPAGRIMAAIGSDKTVTAFNCFVSGTVPDSFVDRDNPEVSSIMHRAEQAATTMRMGGGIGYDFSTLRPDGALIAKLQSRSNGPLAFMPIFDSVCRATSSAGNRRGAQMGVLRIDHPDIRAFISAKNNSTALTGFNISVAVTDEFMEALARKSSFDLKFDGRVHDTVDAEELWETLMRSTWDWAEPGVLFMDRINRLNNLYYAERIAATNPCFTGDTRVWTSKGPVTFRDLAESGVPVKVLTQRSDGKLVYRTMRNPRMTRKMAKLVEVRVRTSQRKGHDIEESIIRVTPNHVFYLNDGTSKPASELQRGDSLVSVYRSLANKKGYLKLRTRGQDPVMEHHVPFEDVEGLGSKYHVHHKDENKQNNDPANLEVMLSHLHNSMSKMGDNNPLRKNPEVSHNSRLDLTPELLLPYFESGMHPKEIAEIFGCSRHTINRRLGRYNPSQPYLNHSVVSVRELDYEEDVYCGTVDETHRFFVSLGDGTHNHGVLVANCSEQTLPPFGACLLGSFNLTKYLTKQTDGYAFDFDWLAEDVPLVVRAMDRVVDVSLYPLPEQEREAKSKRRMGIGVTGLANTLEALGYTYGSDGFIEVQSRILHLIQREAYLEGTRLSRSRGSFELFDAEKYCAGEYVKTLDDDVQAEIRKHGLRNSHYTSIAPTGTISITADNVSSSIEPVYRWKQQRMVIMPEGRVEVDLYDYGFKYLNVRGKRTSMGEVSAAEHVRVLCAAQAKVDSAVSKTINCDGSMPWADFKRVYTDAYEGGAKGCTTFNKDGKRAGLFKETPEAADLPFPMTNYSRWDSESGLQVESGMSCEFDPATGRRSCE